MGKKVIICVVDFVCCLCHSFILSSCYENLGQLISRDRFPLSSEPQKLLF